MRTGLAVLCLNATYEPLGIIGMERAVTLVVTGSADVVLDTGNEIRSQKLAIPEPSVIVMKRMVKARRDQVVPLSRKALFARDNHECAFCEDNRADSIDHVLPRSKGGKHHWNNVVACCTPCNAKKADRTPEEAGMPLRFKPFVPTRSAMMLARRRADWEPFLR